MDERFKALVRHFWGAFFDVEIVHPTAESKLGIGHILAVLAVPGFMMSFGLFRKYVQISVAIWQRRIPAIRWDMAIWSDELFFLTYAAAFMGFVTVFQWETLFLNKRDWMVFGAMPLRMRTILGAKAVSLMIYLGVFAATINGVAMVTFPAAVDKPEAASTTAVSFALHYIVSVVAMCIFVFFFMIALQGLLMNLLPGKLFRRVSPVAQFFCLMSMLSMLLLFPGISSLLRPLEENYTPWLFAFPPMWFIGWIELSRGRTEPVFADLAAVAWPAFWSVIAIAVAMYLLSYYRHVKRSLEAASDIESDPSWFERALWRAANRLFLNDQTERAVFHFALKTALRSRRHWLILSAYAGVGFSIALNALLIMLNRKGYAAVQEVSAGLLSMPLILTFLLLIGLRFIFTIPAELRANWVFRMTQSADQLRYLWAIRKVMLVMVAFPVLAPILPLHGVLWDWGISLHHFLFCLALTWLLMEVLLLRFQKIPFTCSYLPGKANLPYFGGLYVAGFLTYVTSMSQLEYSLLMKRWWAIWVFYGVMTIAIVYLARYRHQLLREEGNEFTFDDPPELAVTTLNLAG